jgi:hypothetical protein
VYDLDHNGVEQEVLSYADFEKSKDTETGIYHLYLSGVGLPKFLKHDYFMHLPLPPSPAYPNGQGFYEAMQNV